MVKVPGGTFTQTSGLTSSFKHTIDSFQIGQYQVTYDLWYEVREWAESDERGVNKYSFANEGREGSEGTDGAAPTDAKNEPVTNVSWRDVIVWCNAYSEMTGLTPVYYTDSGYAMPLRTSTNSTIVSTEPGSEDKPYVSWFATGYRLPSEGEWQYAASYIDGTSWTSYTWASGASAASTNEEANKEVAWYSVNANQTQAVGGKKANALDIYDMSGNVYEWCWDWESTYPGGAQTNYRGSAYGSWRILRGGGYSAPASYLRVGAQSRNKPFASEISSGSSYGFRLARNEPLSLIKVPGGTFTQEATHTTEELGGVFEHTISTFRIARYQVTYDLWYTVRKWAESDERGANKYSFANKGREGSEGTIGAAPTDAKNEPVTNVSWRDAIVWCNAYSEMTGLTPVYYTDSGYTTPLRTSTPYTGIGVEGSEDEPYVIWFANGYRLPTEGEWQYAASYIDGTNWTNCSFASGASAAYTDEEANKEVAWYHVNSNGKTQAVGGKKANALGIYDMSGNVWEWCWDWYPPKYPSEAQTDYRGHPSPYSGYYYRALRGGSYSFAEVLSLARNLSVGGRIERDPALYHTTYGFRLARSAE